MKFTEFPYERIDFDKLKADFLELCEGVDKAQSGEELFALHQKYYKLVDDVMTESVIASIRNDIDMTDPFYEQERAFYDANMPIFRNLLVDYQMRVYHSPHRAYMEEKLGHVAFKNMELAQKAVDISLIPLMQKENELTTEYSKLLASAKIPWEGENLNLSLMTPYLTAEDQEVRKKAWKAYTKFFEDNGEKLDSIYDALVKNRTEQGQMLGYPDFTEIGYARMNRNCYGEREIASFRQQVKRDLVPFVQKLHERRRERLGLEKLYYYDEGVFFKEGNPAPIGTPEEIMAAGQKMYDALSPETAKFMQDMMKMELFDVLGRKNKRTGGYMEMLPNYHMPFIFANFNGTAGDCDVITHECGHAFQGYITADLPIHEHNELTMETAETHSMSMEFFTEPWMDLFFGDRAKDYLSMHFEEFLMFIPYGTMVDEFQNIVYKNPKMTPKERKLLWRTLEQEYKPHLDYADNAFMEEGGFWQKQHHIYDLPYYYIDYCIAGINALQYKAWMDKDFQGAWKSYMDFSKYSASLFFTELEEKVGLMNPFKEGTIKKIVEDLEKNL